MTLDRVLALFRRKIGETELPVSGFTDTELLGYLRDAAEELGLRQVADLDLLVIGTEPEQSGYGIVPEATTEQAHILTCKAAAELLQDKYQEKLLRGELGVNWKSGLEEESTISAEKAWRDVIRGFEDTLSVLILMNKSGSHASRVQ